MLLQIWVHQNTYTQKDFKVEMELIGRRGNQPKKDPNKKGSMIKIHYICICVHGNAAINPITVYNICDVHVCFVQIYKYISINMENQST